MLISMSIALETGDIVFVRGKGFVSKLIKFCTYGDISHVALVYDNDKLFETEGGWGGKGKASFAPIDKYKGSSIEVFRLNGLTSEQKEKIRKLCSFYEGAPYSYWDCAVNGFTFFLSDEIRGWVAEKLGNRKFMKCDELAQRVLYEATDYPKFIGFETSNPFDLYKHCLYSKDFTKVLQIR